MFKRTFIVFLAVISVLIAGIIGFIQSPQFAHVLKRYAAKYIPRDLGIEGDFSELEVNLFPPGIAVRKTQIKTQAKNILGVPEGTAVTAEKIVFGFLPLQMFYGKVLVSKLSIVGGRLDLPVDGLLKTKKEKASSPKLQLKWDELLKVNAESIGLENTRVRFISQSNDFNGEFLAQTLQLSYWEENRKPGYALELDLRELRGNFLERLGLAADAEQLQGRVKLNESGASLDQLTFAKQNLKIEATGKLIGNVLDPDQLKSQLVVRASGRLEEFTTIATGAKTPVFGEFEFDGKASGDLLQVKTDMKFEGELSAKNIRFREWHADEVQAKGSWQSDREGGVLSAQKLVIQSQHQDRVGGVQGGSGGRVEAGPLIWKPKGRERFIIPLKLDQVHIHWAAAPVIKEVFALDFRVTGETQIELHPPQGSDSWTLDSQLDFSVAEFILDNQRVNTRKPLSRVLDLHQVHLKGGVSVDGAGVWANQLKVSLDKTQLSVTGGIDFEEGFEIKASGPADFTELGKIAENKIEGQGTLVMNVHGPAKDVKIDFDLDAQDAKYIGLNFGDLKGRLTWVDDKNDLLFQNMKGKQGDSTYSGQGVIDLGGPGELDRIHMGIDITNGRIQDALKILESKISGIWWFPYTLSGPVAGKVSIEGEMGENQLIIQTNLQGKNWLYSGERFRQVTLKGGLNKVQYWIENARLEKQRGSILGRVNFDSLKDTLEWNVSCESLPVSDLDFISRLDVPIRGLLSIQSAGKGKVGAIESSSSGSLSNASIQNRNISSSRANLTTSQGVLKGGANILGEQAKASFEYAFRTGGQSRISLTADRFEFTPILLLLNSRLMKDSSTLGRVSGGMDLRFRTDSFDRLSGTVELSEYRLEKTDTKVILQKPIDFRISDGSFKMPQLRITGLSDTIEFDLASVQSVLMGSIRGGADLAIAEFFTPVIAQSKGAAQLDYQILGTLLKPELKGRSELKGGSVRIPAIEGSLEGLRGEVLLDRGRFTVRNFEGQLSGGSARANGTIDLFTNRFPEINLQIVLGGNKIKVPPFQYALVRGNMRVKGSEIPYLVDGKIRVESALSTESMLKGRASAGLRTARYTPPSETLEALAASPFKLAIDVEAEKGIFIQNELLDAEVKGQLKVVNTLAVPRIIGTAEVIQGKINFKDRVFQIQSGSAHFDNPTVINPKFDLSATSDVNGTKINLTASGRMDKQKLEFSSNPVLPENEIITLLATGMSPDEAKKIRSGETSLFDQGEAASLLLHSLDFNRDIQKKTGLQIELDEAVNSQSSASVFRPRSDSDTSSAPKIVIKRPIGKRIDVSVGSTVGVGTNNQQQVNAEVKVTPNFSVIGVFDSSQGQNATDSEHSYGVDLKVQKRFK